MAQSGLQLLAVQAGWILTVIVFPRKVELQPNGCIYIAGEAPATDYRSVTFEGKRWLAHRLSYHINKRSIPRSPGSRVEGLVLHKCDNKHCIRPDHLYLGTARQNILDAVERCEGLRERASKRMKEAPSNPQLRCDWTGRSHSPEAKALISKRAKERYSAMTKEQRQSHMAPALERRWGG